MTLPDQPRPPSGRHRWSGEKSALLVLAGVVTLVLVTGLTAWILGGDDETPGDATAASPSVSDSTASPASPGDSTTTSSASTSKNHTPGDNPYNARQVCGKGFTPVDKLTVRSGGTTIGTVHLLFNIGSGVNCAVTLKAVDIGKKTPTAVTLTPEDGRTATDEGSFGYYAGPVKREAANTCVRWGGSVDTATADSGGWTHCD